MTKVEVDISKPYDVPWYYREKPVRTRSHRVFKLLCRHMSRTGTGSSTSFERDGYTFHTSYYTCDRCGARMQIEQVFKGEFISAEMARHPR